MSAVAGAGTSRLLASSPTAEPAVFADRLLHFVLFITILTSSVVFVEPSPHDAMVIVLLVACVIARVKFEPLLVPLALLLTLFNAGGLTALFNVPDNSKAIQYAVTSVYLAVAAILFSSLIAQDTMRRLDTLRIAYIATAVVAAIAGAIGYFRVIPSLTEQFTLYGRARGTFKDPNVFGPFLIWPTLIVMTQMIAGRIGVKNLVVLAILLAGIFLSFSRGAWINFGVACGISLALSLMTASSLRVRMRIVLLAVIILAAIGGFLLLLLSIDAVKEMLAVRAQAVQSYDTGEGGRFRLQEIAIGAMFDYPFGVGPFEFARIFGLQQHNVYLQAFLVYGWIGGSAYLALVVVTVLLGFWFSLVRTPWQPYLVTAFGAYVGTVGEGVIVDTDHWRHFYLLLGMIWGLAAATAKQMAGARDHGDIAAPAERTAMTTLPHRTRFASATRGTGSALRPMPLQPSRSVPAGQFEPPGGRALTDFQ